MTRRPPWPGALPQQDETPDVDSGGIEEIADPDPTVNFPQWSRSLLLLLDYAIIEGLRNRQNMFVHYLKLAEAELTKVVSDPMAHGEADIEKEAPPPSKTH